MKSHSFRITLLAALVGGLSASPWALAQDQAGNRGGLLPQASGGECFARVSVPPVYRTETVEVTLQEASESYSVTEARFRSEQVPVQIMPEYEELEAIQPVLEEVTERLQISPASNVWVRGGLDSSAPLTEGDIADLTAAGIDIDTTEPGSCYYEHLRPAIMKDTTERVLVREATEELTVIPASFRDESKEVVVKAAHKALTALPPVFVEREERVLVAPARQEWKPGTGPIQRIDNTTGEIMCLVDVPAQYDTVMIKAVETPAIVNTVTVPETMATIDVKVMDQAAQRGRKPMAEQYEEIPVSVEASPAQYSWLAEAKGNPASDGQPTGRVACLKAVPEQFVEYTREVVASPGRFDTVTRPAEFENVNVEELLTDATSTPVPVAAVSDSLERVIKVSDARMEWQPVLCQTNMTTDVITELQRALQREGYNPGPIDGVLGRGTDRAVTAYQQDNNMAAGGLTFEVLEALDVKL